MKRVVIVRPIVWGVLGWRVGIWGFGYGALERHPGHAGGKCEIRSTGVNSKSEAGNPKQIGNSKV